MLPISPCPQSPLPQCLGRTLQLPESLLGPGEAASPGDASPLPLRPGGKREAGLGQENRPSPGGAAGGGGRAEPGAVFTARPTAPGTAPAAGCVTRNRGLTLLRPPHPPPALDRPRKPAGAGPGRPDHSPAAEAKLPPAAAPSCRLRPLPPRQPPRGRTGAAGRTPPRSPAPSAGQEEGKVGEERTRQPGGSAPGLPLRLREGIPPGPARSGEAPARPRATVAALGSALGPLPPPPARPGASRRSPRPRGAAGAGHLTAPGAQALSRLHRLRQAAS